MSSDREAIHHETQQHDWAWSIFGFDQPGYGDRASVTARVLSGEFRIGYVSEDTNGRPQRAGGFSAMVVLRFKYGVDAKGRPSASGKGKATLLCKVLRGAKNGTMIVEPAGLGDVEWDVAVSSIESAHPFIGGPDRAKAISKAQGNGDFGRFVATPPGWE